MIHNFFFLTPVALNNRTLLYLASVLIITLTVPGLADAGQLRCRTCHYDIYQEDKHIGQTSVSRRVNTSDKTHLTSVTSLEVSGRFGTWQLKTRARARIDSQGTVELFHWIKEDSKTWEIIGHRHGGAFWLSHRAIEAEKEPDSAAPKKLIEGAVRISQDHFDILGEELSVFLMKQMPLKYPLTVRILDSAEFKIHEHVVEPAGKKTLNIHGISHDCTLLNIQGNAGHSRIWLSRDAAGAFIVKESGKDKDGPYEVRLKKCVDGLVIDK